MKPGWLAVLAAVLLVEEALAQSRNGYPSHVLHGGPSSGTSIGSFGSSLWGARVDGREFAAVGSPGGAGEVVCLADREFAWRARGRESTDGLGWSLAGIDRDGVMGVETLAVGAIQSRGGYWSSIGPGRVELRDLESGALGLEILGREQGDWFGVAICPLDDVDGDGAPELAIGACQGSFDLDLPSSRSGYVSLVSSRDGQFLWTSPGSQEGERFGAQLARIADVDGDGLRDLLVGAAGPPDAAWTPGRIAVLSSATGAQLESISAEHPDLALGSTLESTGDLDGDGCPDALAIGRRRPLVAGPCRFEVLIVSGARRTLRSIATFVERSPYEQSRLWRIPVSIGRGHDGAAWLGLGLPFDSDGSFGENGGAVEILQPMGERVALFAPTSADREFLTSDLCLPRFLGATLTSIAGAEPGEATTWLMSSPGGWVQGGSITFVDGTDWSHRREVRETDLTPGVKSR